MLDLVLHLKLHELMSTCLFNRLTHNTLLHPEASIEHFGNMLRFRFIGTINQVVLNLAWSLLYILYHLDITLVGCI